MIAAVAVLVWTSRYNRLGNFNILPEIKEGCELIQTGTYHFVRHPMYTLVLVPSYMDLLYGS